MVSKAPTTTTTSGHTMSHGFVSNCESTKAPRTNAAPRMAHRQNGSDSMGAAYAQSQHRRKRRNGEA